MSRYAGMDADACAQKLYGRLRLINMESLAVAALFVVNFFFGWVKIPLWVVMIVVVACALVAGIRSGAARGELFRAEDRGCSEDELREALGIR